MNLNVYAIYDKIQNTFLNPMFQHNDGTVIRTIEAVVNDDNKETNLYSNPQDYAIYQVAT